ncbi:MAG: DUF393 domain-containing protein [Thermoleophilaceae bacterium]|nr:DUF393 domain-containing protein [Thermoleophilaceae bacterium]
MPSPDRAAVLYDADCGFCRWSLAKLLAWDRRGRLRPLALQDPEAARLLGDMDEQRRMSSWHLIREDGSRTSGGTALAPLLELLPGGRAPAAALKRFPGSLERGYRWVADHRGLLGKPITRAAVERAEARIAERNA